MQQTKTYKGIDLLEMIFEFSEMTPDSKLWTENSLQNNKSRLIRLKQINSLIYAFFDSNITTNFIQKAKKIFSENKEDTIHTILSGDFLKKQDISDFSELIELMNAVVKTNEKFERKEKEVHIEHLIMPYQQLINYKRTLRSLLTFNSGWLEASSITSLFSIYLTNSISNNLIDKYSELDKTLELFVNPKKLSFTEEELIAKYKFPKDNLHEIDMENW
jgi:hypothetical protein